jgi:phosphoribosylglycinamide formyltransferase 1
VTSAFKVAVLASGTGTNLQALIDQVHGRNGIEIAAVGSDKPAAQALDRARQAAIPVRVFPASEYANDRQQRDAAIATWLSEIGVELVVLAGYMQIVRPVLLEAFPQRIINVHPSLLPAFPGLDAVGQAIAYGVKVFGVTVHYVDEGVDTGPIIVQRSIDLPDARASEDVLPHLHAIEHQLLPEAVRLLAGRIPA